MVSSRLWILTILIGICSLVMPAWGDTVILHDGSSYSGEMTGAQSGQITFTDAKGVRYTFPIKDLQSLVFTPSGDTVTLRNGKIYSGRYTGANPIPFADAEGIQYQFPLQDVASLVFSRTNSTSTPGDGGPNAKVIPERTDISIRTDETIDSETTSPGQLFSATVSRDVYGSAGGLAIPAGTPAKLVVRNITSGGAVHSPELVLDLFSITLNGREYRLVTSEVEESNRKGVGANSRTGKFIAGGAGLGALLGAVFGGGKGAVIGAASGAGGGLLTQILTRGKKVNVPTETELTFRLDRTLVLRPAS